VPAIISKVLVHGNGVIGATSSRVKQT
jgi:hypothetical protein